MKRNQTGKQHPASAHAIEYIPTARVLAIMDANTFDIVRVFLADSVPSAEGEEGYCALSRKVGSVNGGALPKKPLFVFYNNYDGTIGRGIIRRIIRACITFQASFIRTGDPSACRPMGLRDIAAFTGIGDAPSRRAAASSSAASDAPEEWTSRS